MEENIKNTCQELLKVCEKKWFEYKRHVRGVESFSQNSRTTD